MKKPRQPRYSQIFKHDELMQETAKSKWAEVVEHLTENDLLTASRIAIADRYARTYAEYEWLYPTAVSEGPVTKGPNGGDVFNFNWSAVEKLNERLAKFEAKLKIDPTDSIETKAPPAKVTKADAYLG